MKKCVFVTGATSGTGLTIAKTFAKAGYNVVLTSRDADRAEAAAAKVAEEFGVYAKGYALDIRDEDRIKAIFADIDANDCFVETVVLNSADLGYGTDPAKGLDFFEQSVEEFQRVFETNVVWNFMETSRFTCVTFLKLTKLYRLLLRSQYGIIYYILSK